MKKKAKEKELWTNLSVFKQREDVGVKADYVFFFNFLVRKYIYSKPYFSMRGPGSSLFPVKHCWIRKTNMATVSRLRRGFSFNAFPSRTFSRMGSNHRLHKAKIAIFKLFWKYLIVKKCLFLWMICVVWPSLYLMRVGASWLLGELFLKSTIICHGLRYILKQTRGNG